MITLFHASVQDSMTTRLCFRISAYDRALPRYNCYCTCNITIRERVYSLSRNHLVKAFHTHSSLHCHRAKHIPIRSPSPLPVFCLLLAWPEPLRLTRIDETLVAYNYWALTWFIEISCRFWYNYCAWDSENGLFLHTRFLLVPSHVSHYCKENALFLQVPDPTCLT